MLSKDYLRNRHSRLVQMSAQPHALSGSSRGQTCKETLHGYPSGSQHAPDFLSSAGLHGKATSESTGNAWECPKTRTGGHWGALKGWEKLLCTSTSPSGTNCSEGKQQWQPASDCAWTVGVTPFWEINLWDGWSQFWITLLPGISIHLLFHFFFWQPFQQLPSSLPHCQQEQRQLKCLEAPALLRASVITISFLITASIQIRDSNQFSHGIGLGMGRWKKGIFLTLQLSYIFQWLYPCPPPRGEFCPASCRSDHVCWAPGHCWAGLVPKNTTTENKKTINDYRALSKATAHE